MNLYSDELYAEFIEWFKVNYPKHASVPGSGLGDRIKTLTGNDYYQEFLNEKGYVDEAGVIVEPEQDEYGLLHIDGNVRRSDGMILTEEEWQSKTEDEKLEWAGGKLIGNIVTFPDGTKADISIIPEEDLKNLTTTSDIIEVMKTGVGYTPSTTPELLDLGLADKNVIDWTPEDWTKFDDFASSQGMNRNEALKSFVGIDVGGKEDDEGLTDWQKAQLGETQADRELRRQEGNREIATQYSAELQDRMLQRGQTDWEKSNAQTKYFSEQWENTKKEILAELGNEPSNWIKKYQWENKENPYQEVIKPDKETLVGEYDAQIDYWQSELDRIEDMAGDKFTDFYITPEIKQTESQLEMLIANAKRAKADLSATSIGTFSGSNYMDKLAQVVNPDQVENLITSYNQNPSFVEGNVSTEVRDLLRAIQYEQSGYKAGKVEPTLNMPSWLSGMVEGAPSTVAMENAPSALTPSGQSWTRLAPAQQEMWGGYAEHAGDRPKDLLWGTQVMAPKNLQLGKTWKSF